MAALALEASGGWCGCRALGMLDAGVTQVEMDIVR